MYKCRVDNFLYIFFWSNQCPLATLFSYWIHLLFRWRTPVMLVYKATNSATVFQPDCEEPKGSRAIHVHLRFCTPQQSSSIFAFNILTLFSWLRINFWLLLNLFRIVHAHNVVHNNRKYTPPPVFSATIKEIFVKRIWHKSHVNWTGYMYSVVP